jgi:16S rRNA G527 N7-methylase RsmG
MGIGGRVGVHAKRFDALTPWVSPVITARACASLDELLGGTVPFADDRTVFLLLKGTKADEELTAAAKHWTMDIERQASITDPDSPQESPGKGTAAASAGTILKLSHLKRQISA